MEILIESMRKKLILVLLPVLSVFTLSFNCHASVSRSDLKFIKRNLDFFATPVVHQVEASSQLSEGIFAPQKGSPEDNGVIYSIGVGGLESIKLRLNQQKDLEKNQLQKAARSLTRASCKAFKGRLSCREDARQRRFKKSAAIKEEAHKMLSELSQKTQDLNLHRNIDEPISNAVKAMKLHWVHKPQMTVDMIYEDLVLNRYEHVIIISHASSDGLLFDSQQNEIDPNLFRVFGDSVQSLTVFSCFVDKVESKYKWLSGEKSLFPSRYFINLPVSDEIGNFAVNKGDDFVLSKFLKNVRIYVIYLIFVLLELQPDDLPVKLPNESLLVGLCLQIDDLMPESLQLDTLYELPVFEELDLVPGHVCNLAELVVLDLESVLGAF